MIQPEGITVLYDYDSMIYKAFHKIVSAKDIRGWFIEGRSKKWMETEIVHLAINRMFNMSDAILAEIQDTGVPIKNVEYFLTYCTDAARKKVYPKYKENRGKKNKWVSLVRRKLIEIEFADTHPNWEADDRIADRARELGKGNYLLCSMDKDLKIISGLYYDYYRPILKNTDGTPQLNEQGFRIIAPCRGLDYISPQKASYLFWCQMLKGDPVDNIPGLPGVGEKRSEKILMNVEPENYEQTVKEKYIEKYGQANGERQFNLMHLLLWLGTKNRNIDFIIPELSK